MARLHQNKSHVAVCFWIVGLVSKNFFEGFDGFEKILFLECLFALIESRTNFRRAGRGSSQEITGNRIVFRAARTGSLRQHHAEHQAEDQEKCSTRNDLPTL